MVLVWIRIGVSTENSGKPTADTRAVLEKIEPWDEVMAQASDVLIHAEGQVYDEMMIRDVRLQGVAYFLENSGEYECMLVGKNNTHLKVLIVG